jgi:hypothetical protein
MLLTYFTFAKATSSQYFPVRHFIYCSTIDDFTYREWQTATYKIPPKSSFTCVGNQDARADVSYYSSNVPSAIQRRREGPKDLVVEHVVLSYTGNELGK